MKMLRCLWCDLPLPSGGHASLKENKEILVEEIAKAKAGNESPDRISELESELEEVQRRLSAGGK